MRNKDREVMGYELNNMLPSQLENDCMKAILSRDTNDQIVMACANPHSLATSLNDRQFELALKDAEHLICDGMGVYLASNLLLKTSIPRITGDDYFNQLMQTLAVKLQQSNKRSLRVYFFGSTPEVLKQLIDNVVVKYPSVEVVGCFSPPFGDWPKVENNEMINAINETAPDVVWVGMTAPKQEKWVFDNRTSLSAPVIGSIGAVFDFVAGTYPRAPTWACRLGLEWLVRLLKEPKRMWRRTFVSLPIFIKETVKHRLS